MHSNVFQLKDAAAAAAFIRVFPLDFPIPRMCVREI